jgi:hypothetical protein
VTAELMFGNQTLLCQMVLPVRSCAAAIRPDRERAWRARSAGRFEGPCDKGQVPVRLLRRIQNDSGGPARFSVAG